MKIYLANGLFSEADYNYNEILYKEMAELGFEVYAPQKNMEINNKSKCANSIQIYNGDTTKLEWCDIIVAVVDGAVVDPGVASEIGWVAGWNNYDNSHSSGYHKKLILGLCTDSRDGHKTSIQAKNEMLASDYCENQYNYINLYTIGAIKKYGFVFGNRKELIKYLSSLIENIK